MIIHTVLLCKDKDKPPQVTNEPRVYAIVALVRGHQNLGHHRQQSFEGELLKVCQQLIFVDVEDLKAAKRWVLFDHRVTDMHSFVVRVADACFDVRQVQRVLPVLKPFLFRVPELGR
jgi:hypothetical protein